MRFASRADADADEDEAYDALERCAVDDARDARATTTTTTRATRARRATREARVERERLTETHRRSAHEHEGLLQA